MPQDRTRARTKAGTEASKNAQTPAAGGARGPARSAARPRTAGRARTGARSAPTTQTARRARTGARSASATQAARPAGTRPRQGRTGPGRTRLARARRRPSLGAVAARQVAEWLTAWRRPRARQARRRRRARTPLLVLAYRKYSSQLAAVAGVLIVLLSVYLVRQGLMVPSPLSIGSVEPASAEETAQPADDAQPSVEADPGRLPGEEVVEVSPAPESTASQPGSSPPEENASSGLVDNPAVSEDFPPGPDKPVMEPEGPGTSEVGPLSLEECLAEIRAPVLGQVSRPWAVYGWSSCFGDYRYHSGVDIALETGDTIKAALGGLVTSVATDPAMGLTVVIRHGFGLETVCACLGTALVTEGDQVKTGQAIAKAGTSGLAEADQGVHLHFEIRRDGKAIDPSPYLDR